MAKRSMSCFSGVTDIRDALVAFNVVFQQTITASGDLAAALAAGEAAATSILNDTVTNIADHIISLASLGARHFLVPNAPNVGLVPAVTGQGPNAADLATQLSFGFNQALEGALADIELAINTANITRFDTFSFMTTTVAAPELSGFKNVVDACRAPPKPKDHQGDNTAKEVKRSTSSGTASIQRRAVAQADRSNNTG